MTDVAFDVIHDGDVVDVVAAEPIVDVSILETVVAVVTVEGPAGPRGPGGTGAQVFGEVPVGVRDGVNAVFTTANAYQPGSLAVYTNGLREFRDDDYTESGPAQFTFAVAPLAAHKLAVDYLIA